MARVLERGLHALRADRATLSSLIDNEVILEATTGRPGSNLTWVGRRYPLTDLEQQPQVKRAIDTLQPTFGGRLEVTTAAPEFQPALANVKHVAVLPLVHGGQAVGILVLSRYRDEPFGAHDLAALTLIGAISGLALRNARLYARLIAQAQAAERAQSEFMSSAVHELRAPLTVTGGYLAMALEGGFGELPQPVKDVLEIAQRKTEEAKVLADDLLSVARMEGRVLTPKAERFSVDAALQDALARARPRAELVHATLTVDPGSAAEAVADPVLTAKILDNLLNNALSYVEGEPSIRMSTERDGDKVAIGVQDNGIGIAAEDQARIFAKFARGSDRRVLDKPGTGLGLYLSRGLAEQMGGSLRLEASGPDGSTFVVRLPAA